MRIGIWLIVVVLAMPAAGQMSAPSGSPAPPAPTPIANDVVPATPPSDGTVASPPADPPPEKSKPRAAIDLSLLQTRDMSLLYFDPAQTYLTPYVARSFENAMAYHQRIFNWKPWDRTTVLLKDFSDYGNAAARSSPNNAILLDVAPLSLTFETFSPGERFFTLTNHELAHVATMDVWDKRDAAWRNFLHGKPMAVQDHPESILYNYLATPRVNVPRWYLEGSAVFMETWMAGGLGRGQGAYDEMVFRAKVRDDGKFFSPVGLESEGTAVDFQVGVNDYLYGTRFFSYLALTYSPDKVIAWLRRDEGSKPYYANQFEHVFGRSLDSAWADWIVWEHGFQQTNLATLGKYPLTPTEHLLPRGLGSVSRAFYDAKSNSLIGAFRYPGVIGHIGVLSLTTGKTHRLGDIKGAMLYRVTSLAFDPKARTIYYTEDNYAYRDVIAVNIDTGARHMLLRDARIGDLVVNPVDGAIWGIRHQNGFATLVRIPQPHAGFNQIHTFNYGQTPFDLDISADGKMISASVGEIDGTQSVRVWKIADLLAGNGLIDVAKLSMPPAVPEGFVFSADGKSMYGSAYYTGVSNIFRFDLATQKFDAVSNAATGLFRPIPQPDGSLIVYEYGGTGFTPVRFTPKPLDDLGTISFLGTQVAQQRPDVKTWGVGSPAKVPLDSMVTARGHYEPLKAMTLDAAYPIVEGYQGRAAIGYAFNFEDPLQFRQLRATFSLSPFYSPSDAQRLHVELDFKALDWRLRYWHDKADFYDLFGPVERSRKGDAFILGYKKATIYDPPRQLDVFVDAAAYFGLTELPNAQNIATTNPNLLTGDVGLRYANTTKSLGGVDHEKGIGWEIIAGGANSGKDFYPQLTGGFSFGVPLPIHNSSVWLYSFAGASGGPSGQPLGNFYFGAFRNNYVDDREVKRYRELESFPGFDIDGIAARDFAKAIVEWNLPPLRFEEVGTPSIYLSYARMALFGGVLVGDSVGMPTQSYQTLGTQVDLAFTVALRLPMTFSVGVAGGFVDGDYRNIEVLASLKIL
jgi:hypothetical protein